MFLKFILLDKYLKDAKKILNSKKLHGKMHAIIFGPYMTPKGAFINHVDMAGRGDLPNFHITT